MSDGQTRETEAQSRIPFGNASHNDQSGEPPIPANSAPPLCADELDRVRRAARILARGAIRAAADEVSEDV